MIGEGVLHRHQSVVVDLGEEAAEGVEELVGGADPLIQPGQLGGEVAPATEDDADALVGHVIEPAGVLDGRRRRLQRQHLVRFGPLDGDGHDAEPPGFEAERLALDETAAAGGQVVGVTGPVGEELRVDAIGGCVGDGVPSGDDVVPEGLDIGGAGVHAPQPDHCDPIGGAHRLRVSWRKWRWSSGPRSTGSGPRSWAANGEPSPS